MALELRLDNIKWPKDFPELKALDDLLRCGICYGYIKTCMITTCSHNYCSLCIRKSMQYKTQCPTCFEETYEPNLRNNRAFDRFVELFSGIRDKLLRHLRIADLQLGLSQPNDDQIPPCIRMEQQSPVDILKKCRGESSKVKRPFNIVGSSDKASVSRRLDNELVSPPNRDEGLPTIPKMFLSPKKQAETLKPKQNAELPTVPCPVCGVDIPERNINIHLDSCLERSEKSVAKSPEKKKKRSPVAKMVYSMMSEKDLRKRLKDYGLNSQGDKKVLINRMQRYTVLYNSECDSDNPRPVADIIRQIEKEESGEKKNVNSLLAQPRLPTINRKTDPKIIEEENKKYLQENKKSFDTLINSMRSRQGGLRPGMCPKGPGINFSRKYVSESETSEDECIEQNYPETSKVEDADITLLNSSDDELSEEYPTSPVLRSTVTTSKKKLSEEYPTSPMSKSTATPLRNILSEEYPITPVLSNTTPSRIKGLVTLTPYCKGKENKRLTPKIKPLKESEKNKIMNGICETQVLSSDSDSSVLSPSCIVPEDEDSVLSFNSENGADVEDLAGEVTESYDAKLKDSQIEDPDFCEDEDLDQDSEEIFVKRQSKRRKLATSSSCDESPTPVIRPKRVVKTVSSSGTESPARTLRKRAKR